MFTGLVKTLRSNVLHIGYTSFYAFFELLLLLLEKLVSHTIVNYLVMYISEAFNRFTIAAEPKQKRQLLITITIAL